MQKILITGVAGNIGSALASKLLSYPDYYVVGVDNLLTGSIEKLPKRECNRFKFINVDVNNFDEISSIMISFKFDFVFHYAAVVGVQRTLKNPILVLNDIQGIKNILDLCKNTGVQRVFYSSSSEVYGEPVEVPQNESTTPLNSRLPYAIVKNVGEAFLRSYHKEYGLDFTIFRFFNTYGPLQSDDFVITKFIKAAKINADISIYGSGLQTRTFCYVDDNIEATVSCLQNNLFVNDVVNIGNDKEYTIKDLAQSICKGLNSSSKLVFLPPLPEGDMSRRKPDISKMLKILNRPLVPLEEGILLTASALNR